MQEKKHFREKCFDIKFNYSIMVFIMRTCFSKFSLLHQQILLVILFCNFLHLSETVTEIPIGVLILSEAGTPYDIERVGPAIDIAVEKVNSEVLNGSYRLRKVERRYDTVCTNNRAPGEYNLRWLVPLVQFSKKKTMKRYPIFSLQIINYQIDQMHK